MSTLFCILRLDRRGKPDERGIVSFMVVIIIMFVLSLLVLSFARLAQREQRQSLDRQLSSQAFYAAESAVNDAVLQLNLNPSLYNREYNDCDGASSFVSAANPDLDPQLDGPGGTVSYTCLLVDPSPDQIEIGSVPTNESVAIPIQAQGNALIRSLEISWQDPGGSNVLTNCPQTGRYPASWPGGCSVGMLRTELLNFSAGISRNAMAHENRSIAYVQPERTIGSGDHDVTFAETSEVSQGIRHMARCGGASLGPRFCTVTIRGVNLTRGYLRLRSMYRDAQVTVRAFSTNDANNSEENLLELAGVQVEIDATGKANDVLRRIKVTKTIGASSDAEPVPEFAIQTTRGICKRFEFAPSSNPALRIFNVVFPGSTASNNICNPQQTTL